MIAIKNGSSRFVLILFGKIVVKTPRRLPLCPQRRIYFWKGVIANLTEYATFCTSCWRISFLARVYFSCGLVSFQKYIEGRHPSEEEMREMLARLSPEASLVKMRVDTHHLQLTNFVIDRDGRWWLVDYGDHLHSYGMTFSAFLADYADELTVIFVPSQC